MRQLELFGADDRSVLQPAPSSTGTTALARRLPAQLRAGTSSWSFPGWRGLVYGQRASQTRLAREGLRAYAQHPLLRAVGLDRSYYAPLPRSELERYAAQVPPAFRFLVKAHEACTRPWLDGSTEHRPNRRFLDPGYARDAVVGPCTEGLGQRLGPLLFQFPPLDVPALGGVGRFAERLHAFLTALPRGPLYAVELRNRSLLASVTLAALRDAGVAACLCVHPRLPSAAEQRALGVAQQGPALVVRWMLRAGLGYEQARLRYAPFDRLVDEDPDTRRELARSCVDALRAGRAAFVVVNNKAEGSAPLGVERLLAAVAAELGAGEGRAELSPAAGGPPTPTS